VKEAYHKGDVKYNQLLKYGERWLKTRLGILKLTVFYKVV